MTKLAENLIRVRKEKGLTQKELAKLSGCSQTTISDLERGRNEGSKELPDIARVLETDVYSLKGERPPQLATAQLSREIPMEVAALIETITNAAADGSLTPEQAAAFDAVIKTSTGKK